MITAYLPAIFVQGYYGVPFIELATLSSTVRFIYMSEITNSFYHSKYRATAISTISMLVSVIAVVLFGISSVVISYWGNKSYVFIAWSNITLCRISAVFEDKGSS